jgi:hypothetical protein
MNGATSMTDAASTWRLAPGHPLARLGERGFRAAAIAAVVCTVGAFLDPPRVLGAYLVAYLFFVGAALGCLAILMLQYLTGGAWGAAVRRPLEAGARTLPWMAILFVPIALGLPILYEWARPAAAADALLAHKHAYLNTPFFIARAIAYFASWTAIVHWLVRWSREQDQRPDPAIADRLEQLSRGGLVVLGLTMTFASIDWAMSLEPHWYSTIYGVLFMGGNVLTAFAVVIAVAAALAVDPPVATVIGPDQFHDLGKLLLAFVMLWAYFSLSQFLIVWAGNLPEEIPWYLRRLAGGWQWLALALVLLHFALPFVILLSRDLKRNPRRLGRVALGLLVVRWVDMYWLVAPAFDRGGPWFGWCELAALVAVGGFWFALFVRGLAGAPLLPQHDVSLPLAPVAEAA